MSVVIEEVGSAPRTPHNRSGEELAMRDLIIPVLRERCRGARIVHELPLRYSTRRIDLAAISPTEIVAVEIKSSRDVPARLEAQLRGFLPISGLVIAALAPKWIACPEVRSIMDRIADNHLDTWTVCAGTGRVEPGSRWLYRSGASHRPWSLRMLEILHVAELARVAVDHGLGVRSSHARYVTMCHDAMRGPEIVRAVCAALRARAFPWADPPIVVDRIASQGVLAA